VTQQYWWPAYIGLGSNLDNPQAQLQSALKTLAEYEHINVRKVSGFYQSEPYGGVEQNDFINAAAAVLTTLSAEDLLHCLLNIENQQGRERKQHWGPRTLDLDLLVYSNKSSDNEFLRLPHPEIAKRLFVLMPLAEIAPYVYVSGQGRVSDLLKCCAVTRVIKIDN